MIGAITLSMLLAGLGLLGLGGWLARGSRWAGVGQFLAGAAMIAAAFSAGRQTMLILAAALLAGSVVLFPRCESTRHTATYRSRWVQVALLAVIATSGVLAWVKGPSAVVAAGWIIPGAVVVWVWWVIDRRPGADRPTMIWVAVGLGILALGWAVAEMIVLGPMARAAAMLSVLAVPASMIIARSRLGADPRRGLVHVVVLVVAALAYLAAFSGLRALAGLTSGPPSVTYTTVTAMALALTMPLLVRRLRAGLTVLVLGHRADPWAMASGILDRIDRGTQAGLAVVATTANLPYLRLEVDGQPTAVVGVPAEPAVAIDLGVDGHRARLVVGLRDGDDALSPDDGRLLQAIAPLLSEMIRSELLAVDLQAAREQSATARAEERRQLRRDLHDGLGPRLSSLVYAVDASRNLVRDNPTEADQVLLALRTDIVRAVEEVRRLSYGMRPAALDDLGLAEALRRQADTLIGAADRPLVVEFVVRELPAEIPAAVEIAAYRIGVEAIANVVRHSLANRATVLLDAEADGLVVEVIDDGDGAAFAGVWQPGVGLESMRTRAEELGGSLVARPTAGGGRVRAVLPWGR